jgi:hypothetical protein
MDVINSFPITLVAVLGIYLENVEVEHWHYSWGRRCRR